jgi:hypothetical protein
MAELGPSEEKSVLVGEPAPVVSPVRLINFQVFWAAHNPAPHQRSRL